MTSVIRVDNIQSSGGTAALSIDSDGRILTPARPSFFAYRSFGDQADTNYTDYTVVDFDATQHNIGNCYSTSTYKFIAPVGGVYHFSWQVRMANVTSAVYVYSPLRKNGALDWGNSNYINAQLEDPQGGTYQSPGMSVTVQLTAADEIDVTVRVSGDTTTRIQSGTTFFSGYLVG
jgi:hypothetical protein